MTLQQPAHRQPTTSHEPRRCLLSAITLPVLPVLAVFAVLAVACGSTTAEGYDVADRVLAAVDQPVGSETGNGNPTDQSEVSAFGGEDCTITEVIDEYGFINEVSSCASDAPVTLANRAEGPIDAAEVLAAAGDLPLWVHDQLLDSTVDRARPHLLRITEALGALEQSCGVDLDAWTASLGELAARAQAMSDAIDAGGFEGYVATPEAKAISRSLMERSLLLTGCAEPAGGTPLAEEQVIGRGVLEVTARSVQALTRLGQLLDGELSTFLFHFFSSSPNYEWLRTQPKNLDVVVYGTSQAGAGIEVPVLDDELSMLVGNAFLPGSLAEVQQHWFPEVERFVDPRVVVWLVGPLDLLIGCDTLDREQQFTERLARRGRVFNAPGWFAEVEPVNLILGPPGPENTNRGNAAKKPEPVEADIEAHRADYSGQLMAPEFCSARAEVIGESVGRMLDDGRRVVVVAMPVSPLAYEHLPGGPQAASAAIERLRADYLDGLGARNGLGGRNGAEAQVGAQVSYEANLEANLEVDVEVVDLSDVLQDRPELWADYTHPTQEGAVTFTKALAAALKGLAL